jgi:hypothetical protein
MSLEIKCIRDECLFEKNGGQYCCRNCANDDLCHGDLCTQKYVIDPNKLLYCYARCGFNDILKQLIVATKYAVVNNYSIILTTEFYASSKLGEIFDFSSYPCKVFLDNEARKFFEVGFYENSDKKMLMFNHKYPPHKVVIKKGPHHNNKENTLRFFNYIKLAPFYKQALISKIRTLPKNYYGVHIRNTDHKRKINIGLLERYLDSVIDKPVLLITDNKETLNKLCIKYKNIISSGSLDKINLMAYKNLHSLGKKDEDNLKDAITDLFLLANADSIKTTIDFGGDSGYSRLIQALHNHKKLRNKLYGDDLLVPSPMACD